MTPTKVQDSPRRRNRRKASKTHMKSDGERGKDKVGGASIDHDNEACERQDELDANTRVTNGNDVDLGENGGEIGEEGMTPIDHKELSREPSAESFHDAVDDAVADAEPDDLDHDDHKPQAMSSDDGEFDEFQEAPAPLASEKTRKEVLQELRELLRLPDPEPLEDPVTVMERCRKGAVALCEQCPPSSRQWRAELPDFRKLLQDMENKRQ